MRLHIVLASTRPGRVGLPVGQWFYEFAKNEGSFEPNLLDLADFDLPVYDEPHHPRLGNYQHEHTRRWSKAVASGDAYVFVTPEYNHGPMPALVNALNYLYNEWNYKPAGFLSYGGASGGLRAVQLTKPILGALKLVPIVEQIMVPMVAQCIKDGSFVPNELHVESAGTMLRELRRWAGALSAMRAT